MKRYPARSYLHLFVSLCFVFVFAAYTSAEEYEVLKGMKSVKAIFDVRATTQHPRPDHPLEGANMKL